MGVPRSPRHSLNSVEEWPEQLWFTLVDNHQRLPQATKCYILGQPLRWYFWEIPVAESANVTTARSTRELCGCIACPG